MSKSNESTKHEFSVYVSSLSALLKGKNKSSLLVLDDKILHHRLVTVLRVKTGQSFIAFDNKIHAQLVAEEITKKEVKAKVFTVTDNKPLTPHITVLLPLLKVKAFEEALYALVELGANSIVPILTQKGQVQQHYRHERLEGIIIAAAEQAKNYAFPQMNAMCSLQDAVKAVDQQCIIFFDPAGSKASIVLEKIIAQRCKNITLVIGSEGDLTKEEKKVLEGHNVTFCALTPTILRAQQAIAVGLGMFRSFL